MTGDLWHHDKDSLLHIVAHFGTYTPNTYWGEVNELIYLEVKYLNSLQLWPRFQMHVARYNNARMRTIWGMVYSVCWHAVHFFMFRFVFLNISFFIKKYNKQAWNILPASPHIVLRSPNRTTSAHAQIQKLRTKTLIARDYVHS